jgi:Flp pilus assembly protein TadD
MAKQLLRSAGPIEGGFFVRRLILSLSILIAAPAQAEWWEARTEHFIIYSEDDERDTRSFATELERFDHALRSLQSTKFAPIQSDSQRVTIFRAGDVEYISRLAHGGAAGFYRPQLYPVAFTPVRDRERGGNIIRRDSRTNLDPKSVLFHEYAHHFMFQYFPAAYPSWYVEAFAETVATIDLKDDGSFHLGNPPNWRSDLLFGSMLTVTPQSLLASTAKPDFEDFIGWYSVGWLMNHYLTFEPSRRAQLQTYLRLVNQGMDSAPAAKQAFGDLDKLGGEIARYKRAGKLGGIDVRPATRPNPQVVLRKLTDDEEAVMRVKARSKAGVTRSDAARVAADARAVSARYPTSFAAQLALAEAEFDAEQYEGASAAADRALQLRPNSVEALVAKGVILLERGKKDKQYLAPARTFIAKAYALDPADPAPLYLNYLTYYYSGQAIPESAVIGLERAYDDARQDSGLRLVLARQLLAEKKGALARDILLPLGLNPHESKEKKKMRGIIEMIDAGKVGDAYTKLAREMNEAEEKAKKGD